MNPYEVVVLIPSSDGVVVVDVGSLTEKMMEADEKSDLNEAIDKADLGIDATNYIGAERQGPEVMKLVEKVRASNAAEGFTYWDRS